MSRTGLRLSDNVTTLQALHRKLSDIGDEIARNRRHLEELAVEFDRVDSAIRAVSVAERPAPCPPASAAPPERSVPSMILDVLIAARNPMSAREIAQHIVKGQGLDANDRDCIGPMTHRVCVSLWVQHQKGLVRKIEAGRSRFRWQALSVGTE